MNTALLVLLVSLLAGFDIYLSHRRVNTYGAKVELNPVANQFDKDYGVWGGTTFLSVYNIGLLLFGSFHREFLLVLFGLKLGLCMLQLKSLQIEYYVEKLLSSKRKVA